MKRSQPDPGLPGGTDSNTGTTANTNTNTNTLRLRHHPLNAFFFSAAAERRQDSVVVNVHIERIGQRGHGSLGLLDPLH